MMTLGQSKFIKALKLLESDGVLDKSILISAASLRILGFRVYTYFIDILVQKNYYFNKLNEIKFNPKYELEPLHLKMAEFSMRFGTINGDLCSFRHLIKPFNIYEEVQFEIGKQSKFIKIRPHEYVRKDCEEGIEKLIQSYSGRYWQDLLSYHKQIEAIDLGMSKEELKFGSKKFLKFDE